MKKKKKLLKKKKTFWKLILREANTQVSRLRSENRMWLNKQVNEWLLNLYMGERMSR